MTALAQKPRAASFSERVRRADGTALHLIRTYDAGDKPCWFLLRANELGLARLDNTLREELIDLTRFGEVVASGWGHTPQLPVT